MYVFLHIIIIISYDQFIPTNAWLCEALRRRSRLAQGGVWALFSTVCTVGFIHPGGNFGFYEAVQVYYYYVLVLRMKKELWELTMER